MEGFSESENMAYPNKKEHHNTSDIGISNKGLDNNEDKSTKCDTAAGGQTTPWSKKLQSLWSAECVYDMMSSKF